MFFTVKKIRPQAQSELTRATLSPSDSPSIPLSARSTNMKRSAQLVPRKSASRHLSGKKREAREIGAVSTDFGREFLLKMCYWGEGCGPSGHFRFSDPPLYTGF